MAVVKKTALVPYSAEAMYDLVADVEAYPRFLPWCGSATLHEAEGHMWTASIEIARGRVRKTFTTRNRMVPGETIEMHLLEGPFRRLEGDWRFQPLGDAGCKVCLDLEFEFSNRVMEKLIGPVFNEIANTLVDAFCKRAVQVYGKS